MEPVTHILTGACLARSGFSRRIAYATAAMAIAAEFPDIDTLSGLRGPIASFEHHRGITHTFVGLPLEAGLLLAGFFVFHRWRLRRGGTITAHSALSTTPKAAPVRWSLLYGCLLLALLSHLLLDFTNNYGLRPFFPFDHHWYAASIVFIFDPLLFCFLLAGLLMPLLLALVGQEVSGRKRLSRGGVGWPRFALLAVVALWGVRWYEHQRALDLAGRETLNAPLLHSAESESPLPQPQRPQDANLSAPLASADVRPLLQARRSLASPDPLSVFRWYTASDFGPAYRLGVVDTLTGSLSSGQILNKPESSPTLTAAEQSHLGRVFLDWSSMPWISLAATDEDDSVQGEGSSERQVLFEDVRFMGDVSMLRHGPTPPLTGYVIVGRGHAVLEQGIDGKPGR